MGQANAKLSAAYELPPARTAFEVRKYFGDELDAITSGSVGKRKQPSEIRDLLTGEIRRPG